MRDRSLVRTFSWASSAPESRSRSLRRCTKSRRTRWVCDYEYRILDLARLGRAPDELGSLLTEARRGGFVALNITHPCKQLVVDIVDELQADADHLRAANLVVFDGPRMVGYNTDWIGYRDALISGLPGASFDRVVQVGCGGAGAATAYALLAHGTASLELFDIRAERGRGPRKPHL